MILRWVDVYNDVVIPILKDEARQGNTGAEHRYEPEVVKSWWNNAQARLAVMKPLKAHVIYRDVGVVVDQPTRHYRPVALYMEGESKALKRTSMTDQWTNPSIGYYLADQKIVVTGLGKRVAGLSYFYSYFAYYKRVETEDSPVELAEWALEPCAIYVAMQAVTREAMADARYRKFVTNTDAGNPTHNPFLPVAKWLEQRFENIIKNHVDDDVDYLEVN